LLFTGPSNAGKTTLLHYLRNPNPTSASPSTPRTPATDIHLNTHDGRRLLINAADLGGFSYRDRHPGGIRQLRRDYLAAGGVDGVVFVVDAAAVYGDGLEEARGEFGELLQVLGEMEEGRGCAEKKRMPVLVLGNKIDKAGAVAEEELRDLLGGFSRGEASRPVGVFMCSVVMGQGYKEGFVWLANNT
ncbi:ADP-ribosylation factor family-domain-containing protein, partial [Chaetomium tenue]